MGTMRRRTKNFQTKHFLRTSPSACLLNVSRLEQMRRTERYRLWSLRLRWYVCRRADTPFSTKGGTLLHVRLREGKLNTLGFYLDKRDSQFRDLLFRTWRGMESRHFYT